MSTREKENIFVWGNETPARQIPKIETSPSYSAPGARRKLAGPWLSHQPLSLGTLAGSVSDPVLTVSNSISPATQGSSLATNHSSDDSEDNGDYGSVSPADTQSYQEQPFGRTENDAMDVTPMSTSDERPSTSQDRQSGTPMYDPHSTGIKQPAASDHSQRRNDCDSTVSESTTAASKQDMNQVTRDAANQSSQFPHRVPTTEEFFPSSGSGSLNAILPPTGSHQPDGSVVPQNPITPVDKIISTSEREKIFERRIRTPAPRFPVMETSPSFTAPKARRNLTGTWLPHEPLSSATFAGSASNPVLPVPNSMNPATQGSSPATNDPSDDNEVDGDNGSVSPAETQSYPEQTFGGAEGDAIDVTPMSFSNEGPSSFTRDHQGGRPGRDRRSSASKQPTPSGRSQRRKRSDGDSEASESSSSHSPKRRRIDQDRKVSEIKRAQFRSANGHEETPTSIVTSVSSFANAHEKGKNLLTHLDLNSIKSATQASSSGRRNAGDGSSTFTQDLQSGTSGGDRRSGAVKQPAASGQSLRRKHNDGDSQVSESSSGHSPKRRRIDQNRKVSGIERTQFRSANGHEETPTSIVTAGSSFSNLHEKGANLVTQFDSNSIKPASQVSSSGRSNAGDDKEDHGDYRFVSPVEAHSYPKPQFGGAEKNVMTLAPMSTPDEGPFTQDYQSEILECDSKSKTTMQLAASGHSRRRKDCDIKISGSSAGASKGPYRVPAPKCISSSSGPEFHTNKIELRLKKLEKENGQLRARIQARERIDATMVAYLHKKVSALEGDHQAMGEKISLMKHEVDAARQAYLREQSNKL
ncbi:hypothetical protein DFS34DRAFT_605968 [Phlyctochytrium arcticum]|nr:hypothetical protein DFS34DRAFT_605968 [Phlyctochytrium arcticum]